MKIWSAGAYQDPETLLVPGIDGIYQEAEAARIKVDGAWVDVWPSRLYLYKNGNECSAVTGGWGVKLNYYGAEDMENKNGYFDSGNFTTAKGNAVFTTNVIDVSRYSKMCAIIDFERNDARLHSFVMALFKIRPSAWADTPYNKMAEFNIANTTQDLSGTRFLAQFDISGVKEPGYVMLMANCWYQGITGNYNIHTKIYEVWLEK